VNQKTYDDFIASPAPDLDNPQTLGQAGPNFVGGILRPGMKVFDPRNSNELGFSAHRH
jgi:hypothetical protein